MSAIYRCQHCGCVTDISHSLPAFEENPHCRQCGLSVSETDTKMQDELAAMMARNLNLTPHDANVSNPPTPLVIPQPAPITYISQHYHHSTHIVPTVAAEIQVSTILENAGIDASALLPSQFQLFRNAQPDQQQRLIELWRIAPPTPGTQLLGQSSNWPRTSMEQEEAAAHTRWLQREQENIKGLSTLNAHEAAANAEPYMQNGYEGSREWWQVNDKQPMEHQYGMLQQMMHHDSYQSGRAEDDTEMS